MTIDTTSAYCTQVLVPPTKLSKCKEVFAEVMSLVCSPRWTHSVAMAQTRARADIIAMLGNHIEAQEKAVLEKRRSSDLAARVAAWVAAMVAAKAKVRRDALVAEQAKAAANRAEAFRLRNEELDVQNKAALEQLVLDNTANDTAEAEAAVEAEIAAEAAGGAGQ